MINVNNTSIQGDAHLIMSSAGKAILIDSGCPQVSETVLLPELRKRSIKKLDAVFITHPHIDHYGGMFALLNSDIQIGTIYMNSVSEDWAKREWWGVKTGDIATIRELAAKKKIPVYDYSTFEEFKFSDDVFFKKLFIFTDEELRKLGIGPDINELSLIAEFKYKQKRVLFAGDLNRRLSDWLIANHKGKFKCDLLKVPHHGTEGLASNEFFEEASPKYSLIPAPKELWLSKRSERTKQILKKLNSEAFINGIHGTVEVHFAGDKVTITAENASEKK